MNSLKQFAENAFDKFCEDIAAHPRAWGKAFLAALVLIICLGIL